MCYKHDPLFFCSIKTCESLSKLDTSRNGSSAEISDAIANDRPILIPGESGHAWSRAGDDVSAESIFAAYEAMTSSVGGPVVCNHLTNLKTPGNDIGPVIKKLGRGTFRSWFVHWYVPFSARVKTAVYS